MPLAIFGTVSYLGPIDTIENNLDRATFLTTSLTTSCFENMNKCTGWCRVFNGEPYPTIAFSLGQTTNFFRDILLFIKMSKQKF